MKLSRLALLLAAYVSLDVSNPSMPGALCFSAEDSVEARRTDPLPIDAGASALPLVPASKPLTPVEPGVVRSRLIAEVNPYVPRAHVTRSAPASAPSPEGF